MSAHIPVEIRGRLPERERCVAIVGARKATPYGLRIARSLGAAVGAAGLCVVSGAAAGIDEAAHRGAMSVGGSTVAVLGEGLDAPQRGPPRRALLADIQAAGGLVSQFPAHQSGNKWTYPRRNELIAVYSRVVVVVQAGERSGTRHTVGYAEQHGCMLMCVPGPVDDAACVFSNQLLALGRARALLVPADLGRVMACAALNRTSWSQPVGLPSSDPLVQALRHGPQSARQLEVGGVSGASLRLLTLESEGVVRRLPDGTYVLL